MRADYALAWRILRGGGASGFGRLLILAAGLAFTLTTLLLISQLPGILAARSEAVTSRAPVPAVETSSAASFEYVIAQSSWDGDPLQRVFLVGGQDAPPPPGLEVFPGPGEAALSPRAAELMTDASFAAMVPGEMTQTVGQDGLTDPRELLLYVGIEPGHAPTLRPGIGWGLPAGTKLNADLNPTSLPIELAVLVVPSMILAVLAAGRLAASTRRRRNASLRIVGASRTTIQRVSFLENGAATLLGTLIGVALYGVIDAPLGRSGWLGISWYSEQSTYDPLSVTLLLVGAFVVARVAAVGAAARASGDPVGERRAPEERAPSWWALIPLVLGLGLLAPWLPIMGATEPQRSAEKYILAGTLLCAGGSLLAARLLVRSVAGVLRRCRSLGVRLGSQRILSESVSATRLSSGLAFLVLVGAAAAGITSGAEAKAASETAPIRVHVYGNEISEEQREKVQNLRGEEVAWSTVVSVIKQDQSEFQDDPTWKAEHFGVRVLVADCRTAQRLLREPIASCEDGNLYRLSSPSADFDLPTGFPVRFAVDGGHTVVETPAAELSVSGDSPVASSSQLIYTGPALPGGWYSDTTYFFEIPAGLEALDAFSSRLAAVAPTSIANASLDLSAVYSYRVHRAAIGIGVGFAFALAALASLIALVDRNVNRRGLVTSLVTLGTPARTLRMAQVTYAMVPYAILTILTIPVGLVVANAFVNADTGRGQWSWEPTWSALPLVAGGAVALGAASCLVFGLSLRSEDLHHE